MIALRRQYESLFIFGVFELLDAENPHTMTYIKRAADGKAALVMLNFSAEDQPFQIPEELKKKELEQVVDFGKSSKETLSAYEARVWVSTA